MPDDLTARVLAIERCPPIEDGPGQVILTTVSHLNAFVVRLSIVDKSGRAETLGVTGYHKFYSESRKAWVSAKDLHDGERLGYLQRPVTVAALQQLPGTHRVYNLTVENEHVYYVSGMGTLVHNSNCGPNWVNGTTKNPVQLEDFRAPNSGLSGPLSFGGNFAKKVRKHIDQVRNRGPIKDPIPSPGKGGAEAVERIIRDRVSQGGGRATTYAGEAAVAFEDGGVTYIFRPNGEFWTILGN